MDKSHNQGQKSCPQSQIVDRCGQPFSGVFANCGQNKCLIIRELFLKNQFCPQCPQF